MRLWNRPKSMLRLSLKAKIYGLIGGFTALCLAGLLFLMGQISSTHAHDNQVLKHLAIEDDARLVQVNFKKQVQAWKDTLLRGSDPQSLQNYRSEFFRHEKDVQEGTKELRAEVHSPELVDLVDQFSRAHSQLGSEYRLALKVFVHSQGRDFHAADQQVKGKDRPVTDLIDHIVEQVQASAKQAQEQNERAIARIKTLILSLSLFILTILAACGVYIAFGITRVSSALVQQISDQAHDLSEGQGDLTKRFTIDSDDEFGKLAAAFNIFMESLQELIAKLSRSSVQLAGASEEISANARQGAERQNQQDDQTSHLATAMQEMSVTVSQVSENSQRVATAAQEATTNAHHGGDVVEESLGTMRSIADSTNKVAERVNQLGRNSEQIGRIIAVIEDIADKTNLLALNAAIEAARAGEQGRGFAVVADEVRKLAEQTTVATKEISAMVQAIQTETGHAVEAMKLSSQEVDTGVHKAAATGTVLARVIETVQHVGEMIAHIATAATEQSATTEEINIGLNNIAGLSRQSLASARETAQACADLSELALDLEQTVSKFKFEQTAELNRFAGSEGFRRSLPPPSESPKRAVVAAAGRA
jgi:methyl-accepting chemotaxis protein